MLRDLVLCKSCRVSRRSIAQSLACFRRVKRKLLNSQESKQFVEVKLLKTDWIFKKTASADENDLFSLINTLNTQASESLFGTEFITVLIDEFWDTYQMAIIIVVFIPFMIYAAACLIYFTLHQRRIIGTFLGEDLDGSE